MSNVITRGGVIARTTSSNAVPIMAVPEGTPGTDETAAIHAAIDALPSTGGAVMFEARRYLCNAVVARDGVTFICQGGGGDGNVATGFCPYDDTRAALQIGDGVRQLRRFNMFGGRIYSQTNQFGLLLNGADCSFFGVEIGGFTKFAVRITNTATASSYFVDFVACKFFAVANMAATNSRIIDLVVVAGGFVTTVKFIGGSVDGSAIGGLADFTGPCAMSIGQNVEVWCTGFDFQLKHAKGIRFGGLAARLHFDAGIADCTTPGTEVLVEIPSGENSINSFVIGTGRINGQARNNAPAVIECRGKTGGGIGFGYNPSIYEPQFYGWIDLIPTSGTDWVRVQPGFGGSPEGSVPGNAGDIVISMSNTGSSNQVFAKIWDSVLGDVTKGWSRLVSGDFMRQRAPFSIASAATTDILHAAGDVVGVSGAAVITSLGSDTGIDSGLIRRVLAEGAFTYTHTASPTGGQMYCLGQNNFQVAIGDVTTWMWQAAGFGWRMIDHQPFDAPLGHPMPGWPSWTGTKSRASLDTAAATLPQVAQTLAQMIDDLRTRRILGP